MLWEEIHKKLHELEVTAPTKDFASFVNALDNYIDTVSIVILLVYSVGSGFIIR